MLLLEATFFNTSFIGNKDENVISLYVGSVFVLFFSESGLSSLGRGMLIIEQPRARLDEEWTGVDRVGPACDKKM